MTPDRHLRFSNATIIDGTGTPPIDNGVLDVTPDGLIAYVGTAAEAPDNHGADERDLHGRALLPGFIDCHVHLGFTLANGPFHTLQNDPALIVLESVARIRATLEAGITSARDLGGLSQGFREAIDQGLIPGPRLKLAVSPISHTAGHGDMHLHGGALAPTMPELIEIADTVDEVRKQPAVSCAKEPTSSKSAQPAAWAADTTTPTTKACAWTKYARSTTNSTDTAASPSPPTHKDAKESSPPSAAE